MKNSGLCVCRSRFEFLLYTEMSVLMNHLYHSDHFDFVEKLKSDLKDLRSIRNNLIKILKECEKQINYVSEILGKDSKNKN